MKAMRFGKPNCISALWFVPYRSMKESCESNGEDLETLCHIYMSHRRRACLSEL
jgi:hypothetical protein